MIRSWLSPCGMLAPGVNVGSVASGGAGVVVPVNSDSGETGGVAGSGAGAGMPVTAVLGRLVNEAG